MKEQALCLRWVFRSVPSSFCTPTTEAVQADLSACQKVCNLLHAVLTVVLPILCQGLSLVSLIGGCFSSLDLDKLAVSQLCSGLPPFCLDALRTTCCSKVKVCMDTISDVSAIVNEELLMASILSPALLDSKKDKEAPQEVKVVTHSASTPLGFKALVIFSHSVN